MRPAPHCRLMHSSSKNLLFCFEKGPANGKRARQKHSGTRRNARDYRSTARVECQIPRVRRIVYVSHARSYSSCRGRRDNPAARSRKKYEPTTADAGCDHEPSATPVDRRASDGDRCQSSAYLPACGVVARRHRPLCHHRAGPKPWSRLSPLNRQRSVGGNPCVRITANNPSQFSRSALQVDFVCGGSRRSRD
jgi:hypothetical protein